ncbi:MAG: 23S rRNA (uracil(1939)-C(5))-methyltransferase RlmD [Clostridia bacterium]|nr:23S rRNA (uracil(1939)-C(5))-methyltransferase RlmD [Clostridia bacterium]
MKKNDQVCLHIDDFGASGEGVAHLNGVPVFVSGALPGEDVNALLLKVMPRYAYAKVLEIIKPSDARQEPECAYYPQCGGCTCQHMTYEAQLKFKQSQVRNCLLHIGGIDVPVEPVIGADEPWYYRNKCAMPVAGYSDHPEIGYYAARSHRVINIEKCLLASADNDTVILILRDWIREFRIRPYDETTHTGLLRHVMIRTNRSGQMMVVLVINGKTVKHAEELLSALRVKLPNLVSLCISENTKRGNVILGEDYRVIWGDKHMEDTLCGCRFQLSPLSFFQVNPAQTEKLYNTALSYAGLSGSETVADLYCGVGTISLMLAKKAKHVTGIEIVPQAIDNARKNAELNHISNAAFYCGATEKVLPELVAAGLKPDVVVLDPPRKGADENVLKAIVQTEPERIVYVSCDPATLARDAKYLNQMEYKIKKVQPVDMFCQTSGIETVCLLSRL